MEQIKDIESYADLMEILMCAMSQNFSIMKMIEKEEDYERYLTLISYFITDEGYTALLSLSGWNKILSFVSDCRFIPNVTEEQFQFCNQLIFEINKRIFAAQEIEEKRLHLTQLYQELSLTIQRRKRKELEQEINQVNDDITEYYNVAIQDVLQIHDTQINQYGNYEDLPLSLINEVFLIDLLCNKELDAQAIIYLIQSPYTPYAMARMLNLIDIDDQDKEKLINVINAASDYIETGKAQIIYQNQIHVLTCTEKINDYSTIIKNDAYQRLSCYIRSIPYQKTKEHQKIKKR